MSKYMVLIHERESDYATLTPEGWQSVVDGHAAFVQAVGDLGGTLVGGEALQPTDTAASIRGGEVSDGPLVRSPEALLGWYVVEARDFAHALEIGKTAPAQFGGVEVRPILDNPAATVR